MILIRGRPKFTEGRYFAFGHHDWKSHRMNHSSDQSVFDIGAHKNTDAPCFIRAQRQNVILDGWRKIFLKQSFASDHGVRGPISEWIDQGLFEKRHAFDPPWGK
ncbi:hypothetical protein EH32_08220 [Erythrobacter litoralis]|uniref:Uncharacterized protein n=1 Tax=Erythrobacter litoralis TaxID=39960 RepID=A0A074N4G2_9SPHN|nr:hypothetical protein EH32_08220 [Erythrobacter litoralis]